MTYIIFLIYGDDNILILNIKDGISFTFQNIVRIFKLYGQEYTDSQKRGVDVPLSSINEVDFLKRKFFKDSRGFVAARLSMTSMYRALTWCNRSSNKDVSLKEQNFQTLMSVLYEKFLYGREDFELFRVRVLNIIEKYDFSSVSNLYVPSYSDLEIAFRDNKFTTWNLISEPSGVDSTSVSDLVEALIPVSISREQFYR